MKKTILTIATFAILAVANANAQYAHKPIPKSQAARIDNAIEDYKIDKLDKIVNLTRRQENELKKIENRYDRLLNNRRLGYHDIKRLEQDKQQDIWSVLTPVQRQRLIAYQQPKKIEYYPHRRG